MFIIIYTMDDVLGDFVGPSHGITPVEVITNENKKSLNPSRAKKTFIRMKMG